MYQPTGTCTCTSSLDFGFERSINDMIFSDGIFEITIDAVIHRAAKHSTYNVTHRTGGGVEVFQPHWQKQEEATDFD